MSRWFRLYDELLDEPKVQRLHSALFKVLINVWCVASRHDGRLPSTSDLSFALRMSEDETLRAVSKLAEAGLIDTDTATGEQRPHGWNARQYRSDVSTDRVRAHRERQKSGENPDPNGGKGKGKRNADETFHETPPEAETETDNSVAKATGTVVPHPAADFAKVVFDSGVALLVDRDRNERQARSIIGRWRKQYSDPAVLDVLRRAEIEQASNSIEWITKALEAANDRTASRSSPSTGARVVNAGHAFVADGGYH